MSQDKREILLEAGIELLAEKTFSEISMDLVAEKSGLSKPMIYYYFKSKEGYYRALAANLLSAAAENMESMFNHELTLRENLKRYMRGWLEAIRNHPARIKAYLSLLYDPNIRLYTESAQERFEEVRTKVVEPLFMEAVNRGEIDPSYNRYLVMMAFHSVLIGYTFKEFRGIAPNVPEFNPVEFVDIIMDGIGTRSGEGGS